ncbi:hypothetical protein ES703_70212 [subsurface metagenome]
MAKEHPDWHRSIASVRRDMRELIDVVKTVNERVDIVYDKLKMEDEIKHWRGEDRLKHCMYSEDGYCVESEHAVDPKTVEVSTVKKGDLYYPQITWFNCEVCSRYFLGK